MSSGPLAGIRVLELGHFIAAPVATLILADLGAEVVKVEPVNGESSRASTDASLFDSANRNKSSLSLDLKSPEAVAIFLRLAATADVIVTNYRTATLRRLGIDYETLAPTNPRLIYCSIRGFNPGPYGSRGLMDEAAQMISGLAYMTGPPGQPLRAGASVIDYGAAIWSVISILAALLTRARSNSGQQIDTGLYETAAFLLSHNVAQASRTGQAPVPMPARGMGAQLGVGLYRLFAARDGKRIFIGVASDAQWQRFCQEFDLNDLADDGELATRAGRAKRAKELEERVVAIAASQDSEVLLERLERCQVTYAPVNTPLDLLTDPHLRQSAGLLEVPPRRGETQGFTVPALPFRSTTYARPAPSAPPQLGQDSRTLLQDIGVADADIDRLIAQGTVRVAS